MSSRDWALTVLLACLVAAIALFFKASVALTIFLFVGVLAFAWALFDPWLRRHLLLRWPKTQGISTDPRNGIRMALEEERWDIYKTQAWILRAKLRIRNQDRVSHRIESWALSNVHPLADVVPGLGDEMARLQRDHPSPPSLLEPGKAVEGWYLARLAWTPVDGIPAYELRLRIETGQEYGFRRLPDPKRQI